MADLPFNQALNAGNRTKSKLELSLIPEATAPVYVTVPSLSGLDGWKPATTTTRTPLYNSAGGAQDFVSTRQAFGPQAFMTVAPPTNATVQAMITKAQKGSGTSGSQVLARYTDANGLPWQGQAVLVYDGESGNGVADNVIYSFKLEWIAADTTYPTIVP